MRREREDGGQAAVELALVLPLVVLVLLALVQAGLVVRDQILVVHAAREAVRQAAVDPSTDAARQAALAGSSLPADRLTVAVEGRGAPGSKVTVRVSLGGVTRLPLVGEAVAGVTLRAHATMRVER